jgi:PhzF family phenazine biosynthesis protein
MKLKIAIVDAFTQHQFAGNQAAVVSLDSWLDATTMQNIASENNLAETAFFVCNAAGVYDIRWFSPIKEIDFCGHATLASSHVIFTERKEVSEIRFWAKAVGEITVQKKSDNLIEMAFPSREPVELTEVPEALRGGLSVDGVAISALSSPVAYLKNNQAYFVVLSSEAQVKSVVPDLEMLKTLDPLDVVVTAAMPTAVDQNFDFVSRYFWPANGGVEDPVTGSIHAGLAPYWAKKLGKSNLVALQASQRTGTLFCRVEEDTVFVSGYCVSYLEGHISV